jgi:hypothetical protein
LIASATLTRTGVFVYRNADGSVRREYRPSAEVAKADSLETLKLAPITNQHPPVMVDAANAKQFCVGQVGQDVTLDGINVVSTVVINDGDTIRELETGSKRDVSCGYVCDLDETPGVSPDGDRYDAVQKNIKYNHLAVVPVGRAGNARIRMDGEDCVALVEIPGTKYSAVTPKDHSDHQESIVEELEKALAKITELTETANAASKRADAAETAVKELELKLTKAEADVAAETVRANAEKARADGAEKARTDADESFDARVQARAELIAEAVSYLGRNDSGAVTGPDGVVVDVAKSDSRTLKCLVVEKLDGIKIEATRSDDAVNYAYELATSRSKQASAAVAEVHNTIHKNRADGVAFGDAEAKAYATAKDFIKNAWKAQKESK